MKTNHKNIKEENFSKSADKEICQKEEKKLPTIEFYNGSKLANRRYPLIVVLENEEFYEYYKKTHTIEKNTLVTTIVGGVDRDIHCLNLFVGFYDKVVVLIGREEKFKKFKKALTEITRDIFEHYVADIKDI